MPNDYPRYVESKEHGPIVVDNAEQEAAVKEGRAVYSVVVAQEEGHASVKVVGINTKAGLLKRLGLQ